MQGDYGLFQCSLPCHDKTYENRESIISMLKSENFLSEQNGVFKITDLSMWKMKVDKKFIPKCPVCARVMEMNLRKDEKFIQDEGWYARRTV